MPPANVPAMIPESMAKTYLPMRKVQAAATMRIPAIAAIGCAACFRDWKKLLPELLPMAKAKMAKPKMPTSWEMIIPPLSALAGTPR